MACCCRRLANIAAAICTIPVTLWPRRGPTHNPLQWVLAADHFASPGHRHLLCQDTHHAMVDLLALKQSYLYSACTLRTVSWKNSSCKASISTHNR